ncbi:MAG: sodium:proton exchanger, partial [Pyrobaculum sp.]
MDLGVLSLAVALGVFFAYLVDRLGYPPLLGFLAAGFIAGSVLRLSVPDILLQMLIALVAFEAGRQLGSGSLSPAAFFAVILEAAFVAGLSISVFRLMGFSLREALIVAVMLLSSSSLLVLKFTEGLPPEARNVAISLTTLEDT